MYGSVFFQPNNKASNLKSTDDLSGVCQIGHQMIITEYVRDNLTLPLTETEGEGGGDNRSCVEKLFGNNAIQWLYRKSRF